MKVTFNYGRLLENLTDLSTVVEDVMSGEDMKNIIFRFTKDSIKLIGINQLVTFKRTLPSDMYRLEVEDEELKDGVAFFQIKSKEIISYLGTYKALRRTEVEDVELSLGGKGTKVICKVAERDVESGQTYIGSYDFNNIPIKNNLFNNINLTAPDDVEGETIPMLNILFHTRNLLPIMKNDTGLFGQLVFGEDGVVVAFNASFTTFMNNKLPSSFRGIKLSYRAISFIDKIFDEEDQVVSKKLDRHIHIYSESSDSEAFIVYDNKMPNYTVTKELFVKDHAFVLDRVFLKDILKRLSIVNESIEVRVNCEEDTVELRNSKFHQTVSILQKKALEEYSQINFKILPDTLNKVVIGSDDEFSPQTFIYYCPQPNGDAVLVFADSSGQWFSTLKVRPYK